MYVGVCVRVRAVCAWGARLVGTKGEEVSPQMSNAHAQARIMQQLQGRQRVTHKRTHTLTHSCLCMRTSEHTRAHMHTRTHTF